ncbi:MAG: pre-peptidase C-terminal domain-containing protein [Elainella sp. Prado103]|jgi:hypothetical protein|nr:pre-peptidase C-terminal domain-containing protein [Elainella sp. Prado103]
MAFSRTVRQIQPVRQVKLSNNPLNITGQFKKDKEVFYRFKLNRSSEVYLSLSPGSQRSNADLQLLNSKQKVLKRSANPGAASELIATNLQPGEYVVRVSNRTKQKGSFRLRVSTSDELPTLANQLLSIGAGGSGLLSSAQLQASDKLQAADQLRYTMTTVPGNGILQLNGVTLKPGDSFTQADIDQGKVRYSRSSQGMTVLGNGSRPLVSGFSVAWEGFASDGGTDREIFLWDGQATRQITRNSVEDRLEGLDGSRVVWSSQDGGIGNRGIATYELYSFDGTTGATTKLTTNNYDEDFVGLDGANIFWSSPIGAPDRKGQVTYELFYHNGVSTLQLTNNAANEVIGNIEGATAVWSADVGPIDSLGKPTNEVLYFNGSSAQQITNNTVDDTMPILSKGRIVWASRVGAPDAGIATYELFQYAGTTRQLTFNNVDDFLTSFVDNQIVWMSRLGGKDARGTSTFEVFQSDGAATQRLTNNAIDEAVIQADGTNILWMSLTGQPTVTGQPTYELYYYNGALTRLTTNGVNDLPAGLERSKAVWYSQVGPTDAAGLATRELFLYNGAAVQQLTTDRKNDDFPSFSETTLAWRSTDGATSQVLRYDLGDSFKFRLSDRPGQSSPEQTFRIDFR